MTVVYRKSLFSTVLDRVFVRMIRMMAHRRARAGAPRMFIAPDDYIGETILAEGTFEKGYLGALDTILERMDLRGQPDTVALDIGANIGNHALHFSRSFSRVLCFDPNPMIARVLEANVILNDIRNIEMHRTALSDADETLPYVQHDSNLGGSGFLREGQSVREQGARQQGQLQLHHAGRYVGKHLAPQDRVALIKIDVEGLEDKVLDGLRDLITKHQPLLLIEVTGDAIGERVKELVADLGYDPLQEIHNDLRFGGGPLPLRLLVAALRSVTYQIRPLNTMDDRIYPMTITAPAGRLREFGLI